MARFQGKQEGKDRWRNLGSILQGIDGKPNAMSQTKLDTSHETSEMPLIKNWNNTSRNFSRATLGQLDTGIAMFSNREATISNPELKAEKLGSDALRAHIYSEDEDT